MGTRDSSQLRSQLRSASLLRRSFLVLLIGIAMVGYTGCRPQVTKQAKPLLQWLMKTTSKTKQISSSSLRQLSKTRGTSHAAILLHKHYRERYDATRARHDDLQEDIERLTPRLHPDDAKLLAENTASDTAWLDDVESLLDSTEGLAADAEAVLDAEFNEIDERMEIVEQFVNQFG